MVEQEAKDKKLARVVHKMDSAWTLLRAWAMAGGVSAQVTALEIARPDGETHKLILRQHGALDMEENPRVAELEFNILRLLRAAGIAVPVPYYLDETGEIFDTPYIVVEFIEGGTDFAPANVGNVVTEMATQLARIHQLDNSNTDLSFLGTYEKRYAQTLGERPARLDDSIDEGRIRDALEKVWPWPQRNSPTLIHGDFWPGNIVWRDGHLAGIIDWEDAAMGDPLVDVANGRLEILWAYGSEAMDLFTRQYESLSDIDFHALPCLDLWIALRPAFRIDQWAADVVMAERMRERHAWFVAQAIERL